MFHIIQTKIFKGIQNTYQVSIVLFFQTYHCGRTRTAKICATREFFVSATISNSRTYGALVPGTGIAVAGVEMASLGATTGRLINTTAGLVMAGGGVAHSRT